MSPRVESSSSHLSAALRRFAGSVLAKAQESVDLMTVSGDMESLKNLCESVNKLAQTLNKLSPESCDRDEREKSTDDLVGVMTEDDGKDKKK